MKETITEERNTLEKLPQVLSEQYQFLQEIIVPF